MTKFTLNWMALVLSAVVLSGCSVNRGFEDLDQFMATADKVPGGPVDPVPVSRHMKRSPTVLRTVGIHSVRPWKSIWQNSRKIILTLSRILRGPRSCWSLPNHLIKYGGHFAKSRGGTTFALVSDGSGGIHRVKGKVSTWVKSFGKIISIDELAIKVMEIVLNGHGGWFERPRTMGLEGSEQ